MSTRTQRRERESAFAVQGMHSTSCVAHVETAAAQVPGVVSANVNLVRGRAVVHFNPDTTDEQTIAQAITKAGYAAAVESPAENANQNRSNGKARMHNRG